MLKQVACRSDTERGKENESKLPPHLWILPPGFHTPSVRICERDGTCSEIYGPLPDGTNCLHCIYVVVGTVSTLEMVYNKAYMQVPCHFIYYPYFSVYFLFFEAGFHSVM